MFLIFHNEKKQEEIKYNFSVDQVEVIEENKKVYTGHGELTGFTGGAVLSITYSKQTGKYDSSVLQKMYKVYDDPVWQLKSDDIAILYDLVNEETLDTSQELEFGSNKKE